MYYSLYTSYTSFAAPNCICLATGQKGIPIQRVFFARTEKLKSFLIIGQHLVFCVIERVV